jgi:predicted Zn-dependent protease
MHLLILFALAMFHASSNRIAIERLQPQADAILNLDPVQARPRVRAVLELADDLEGDGRLAEADHYYNEGLRIEPNDYLQHLFYADLLQKLNRPADAAIQAQLILNGCEDQALILKAQGLIGTPPFQVAALDDLPTAMPILVLVPLGDVDLSLLQDEQTKLHDALHINVMIRSVPFKMPAPDRYPPQRTPDNRQWNAEKMMSLFADAVHPFEASNVRFLGITRNDIYAGDKNYYFGWSDGDCSIVSYSRFLAIFNSETPERSRLLRRFHFQCLTSAGHVFGLERCMDSSCPLGYAQSVAEQDAKSDTICDTCRKGFDNAFAQYTISAQNTSTTILIGLALATAISLVIISLVSRRPLPLTALVIGLALLVYTTIGIAINRAGNSEMYPAFGTTFCSLGAALGIAHYGIALLLMHRNKKLKSQQGTPAIA